MADKEKELQYLDEIIESCRRLYERNYLAAADGNVSYRFSDNRILITPTGRPKGFLKRTDIAIVKLDGEIIAGSPSAERVLHLEIYRKCPEAKAIVHAHPPTAVAWSIADPSLTELPSEALPEVILATGRIPIVPYQRPTTSNLATEIAKYVPEHRVMIMARHGAISWGASIDEATMGIERVEHAAEILQAAKSLGGITPLPSEELAALKEMRKGIGAKTL